MGSPNNPPDPPQRPDGLPDLSLYSSPDLAMHLLAELEIRHQNDVLVFFIQRDVDGDRPALFQRIVGDENRVEGLVASLHRHVKRTNDKWPGPWRGDASKREWQEAGPVPGAAEEASDE